MLVLLPHIDANVELGWIKSEITKFESNCKNGRLIVLKYPSDPPPDFLKDRQVIDISTDELFKHFLVPLFRNPGFINADQALNLRIPDAQLRHDAEAIENALQGLINVHHKLFGEFLIVETINLDLTKPEGLDDATVRAPNGCSQILNWDRRDFSWHALHMRALENVGKGTFWVREMEQVIATIANHETPEVMTSTFRGRGREAGAIFRPQLESVDYVSDRPVRFHFFFHEVLVPELVRGPAHIGEVFDLLHIATRMRWEVLNPFLVKLLEETPSRKFEMNEEEKKQIVGAVMRSIRIIDEEADRHKMFDPSVAGAFEGDDRKLIIELLQERSEIHKTFEEASRTNDFEQFTRELMEALELNGRATELLARRFLELAQEDREQVKKQMRETGLTDNQA